MASARSSFNSLQVKTLLAVTIALLQLLLIVINVEATKSTMFNNNKAYSKSSSTTSSRATRIAKGTLAATAEFPFQVAIIDKQTGGQFCSGSMYCTKAYAFAFNNSLLLLALVTPYWIVTAGHCTEGSSASGIHLKLGLNDLSIANAGVTLSASQWILHPNYDTVNINHDISLIKLATPVTLSSTIKLAVLDRTANIPVNTAMVVSGWGYTEQNRASNALRKVTVPMCSGTPYCSQHGSFYTSSMLCAGDGSGRDAYVLLFVLLGFCKLFINLLLLLLAALVIAVVRLVASLMERII